MPGEGSPDSGGIRAAEVMAALSLATDLGMRVPIEHGLHSTLVAMRLAERLGVDRETASQAYYACLLFYVGCTADADVAARVFGGDDSLTTEGLPFRFGSRPEMIGGVLRALATPGSSPVMRGAQIALRIPRAASAFRHHTAAFCEVAQMLTARLGLPESIQSLFAYVEERWDGHGRPGRARGDEIPLPVRIVQVARDAAVQRMLGGVEFAGRVLRERAGHAFDPSIAGRLADDATEILALDAEAAWDETIANEPSPRLLLEGEAIDRALAAMGDFADLASPYLVEHSRGVAAMAAAAAERVGFAASDVVLITRAGHVHDVGRAAVPVRIWQKAAALTPDDWEQIRLHAYHSERILVRSPFLAELTPVATTHHERLDGSGYHRGMNAVALTPAARLLAAADAFHAMTEPRPHREALPVEQAAAILSREAGEGRLDADAVAGVIEASGQPPPRIARPAGLTERETEVVGLIARGLQTKQVARALGISVKTADRHIQNAYGKIGVSTRAAATLFAMQHGLAGWGELPIPRPSGRS